MRRRKPVRERRRHGSEFLWPGSDKPETELSKIRLTGAAKVSSIMNNKTSF
jgi:hypothetical protein